ncbi:hypothetical protein An14g05090 [Aspergillus niger]|uniref:Uncharacterized protein n=2 Tax=Aspergillus niger TaxID=5061 RepID=A2R3Q2_ASPNC|nr:hypothetical protein An14g05090 [Aspergillus niger]CAK42070.1 hypothetical protein An14g05090 [Aspergillus niger]
MAGSPPNSFPGGNGLSEEFEGWLPGGKPTNCNETIGSR